MRRLGGGVLLACVVLANARAASNEPIPVRVAKGAGAEGCPSADAVSARTNESMTGTTLVAGDGEAEVSIEVQFAHDKKKGFGATIRIIGGDRAGVRTLEDSSAKCDDLAEAVVVTLRVMLDRGPEPPAPSVSETVALPAPPPPAVIAPPARADVVPRRSVRPPAKDPSSVRGGVNGGALLGVVGPAAPFVGIDLELLTARRFGLAIGGFGVFPQHYDIAGGGAAELSMVAAEATACATLFSPRTVVHDVGLCAIGAGGVLRGRTHGLFENGDGSTAWFAAGSAMRVAGPLAGPISWMLRASGLVPFRTQSFAVAGVGTVYEPAIVAVSVAFGLSMKIL